MMIHLQNGSYVNSDTIRTIYQAAPYKGYQRITLQAKDNEHEYFAVGDVDELAEKINATIVPALPGYELILSSVNCDETFGFSHAPIIAWNITAADEEPTPVAVDGSQICEQPQAILCPDHTVIERGCGRTYDDITQWQHCARKKWEEARTAWLAEHEEKAAE
jgi:hypothetical protein